MFDEDADDIDLEEIISKTNNKNSNKNNSNSRSNSSRSNNNKDIEEGDDDSDAPEEVTKQDDSIQRLKELHSQLNNLGDASKKRKRSVKLGEGSGSGRGKKEKKDDDEEIDPSVLDFLEEPEEEEAEEGGVGRGKKESDVVFRIEKDVVRSRKM